MNAVVASGLFLQREAAFPLFSILKKGVFTKKISLDICEFFS